MENKTANQELDEYFLNLRAIKIHFCPLCRIECFEEDMEACQKEGLPLVCTNCIPVLKKQMEICLPLLSTIKF